MRIWFFVFLLLPLAGIIYTFWHMWQILPLSTPWRVAVLTVMTACVVVFFGNFSLWNIDRMPMTAATWAYNIGNSTLFMLLYVVMIFLVLDIGHLLRLVPRSFLHQSVSGTLTVVLTMVLLFTYGYFHYRHKARQPIELTTTKAIDKPLRIVMLSDLHLGYHNQKAEVDRWIDLVNAERPDLVLIAGDIIDGHMRPLDEQHMEQCFRRVSAPIVACLGNHEYYTGLQASQEFYRKAGIHLLQDSAMTISSINIIGRDDRTNLHRKSVKELMAGLDTTRYTILLDHQPYNLEQAEQAGVDFQLSGHTHYGQVWPISWIIDAIYEDGYGPLTKGRTQYFVTSGIGIWGGKYRIGTRSEYLVAELKNNY